MSRLADTNSQNQYGNFVHGECHKTPEHRSWASMKARCFYKSHVAYDRYGGRGITVCDRWLGEEGYQNFLSDMGRKPPEKFGLTLLDNQKNYSPENCKWADRKEMQSNRLSHSVKMIEKNGKIIPYKSHLRIWVGAVYEKLIVVSKPYLENDRWLVECICECGKTKIINTLQLQKQKTCGCRIGLEMPAASRDSIRNKVSKHGMKYSTEYRIWPGMKDRCLNKNSLAFRDYGERGITVCDRWINSFVNFYQDMGPRPEGKSIDRLDNNKGYSPENCGWRTTTEQNRNRRTTKFYEFNGKTMSTPEIAEILGLSQGYVWRCLRSGMSAYEVQERALSRKAK